MRYSAQRLRILLWITITFFLAFCIALHNYIRKEWFSTKPLELATKIAITSVDIAMVFAKVKERPNLHTSFDNTIATLVERSNSDINFHIFCDFHSCPIAKFIFGKLNNTKLAVNLRLYDIDSAGRLVKENFSEQFLSNFRHDSGSYYGDALFFISLVLWQFEPFSKINRVIKVDVDLKILDDIADLWKMFDDFEDNQLIGLALEQSPVYRHVFSAFRSKNTGTRIGDSQPGGITGFNSGVTLLNLAKIRRSADYLSFLQSPNKMADLAAKYQFKGHLGDQDFYTLLSVEREIYFYRLPCVWNRQLCEWWKNHGYSEIFDDYHNCSGKPKILHGNCNTPYPEK